VWPSRSSTDVFEPTVAVGRVTRAHGVAGEVAVLVLSEVAERFEAGAVVYLEDGRALTVQDSRPHGGSVLVKFREIRDRDRAQGLVGALLVVPESMSPNLPEGSWWDYQLVGCEVVTESGRSLGALREVIHTPANDVWSAVGGDIETLVPVLKDVIVSVDVAARRIVVREIPGLTVPEGGSS
jgi:16S rRNA processing protein RimM